MKNQETSFSSRLSKQGRDHGLTQPFPTCKNSFSPEPRQWGRSCKEKRAGLLRSVTAGASGKTDRRASPCGVIITASPSSESKIPCCYIEPRPLCLTAAFPKTHQCVRERREARALPTPGAGVRGTGPSRGRGASIRGHLVSKYQDSTRS